MALKLVKPINMVNHEYWVAEPHYNADTKQTQVLLRLYTSEALRKSGQKSVDRISFPVLMEGSFKLNGEIYTHLKQPIKTTSTKEEDGKTVIIETETNQFASAEDVL